MQHPDIPRAAQMIREGRLVAFPTETVYGLGANALDPEAIARIYEAKGRPASSPLIVHVDSPEMARELVSEWPAEADLLVRRYWPGPLTLVLNKSACVPDALSAGLGTVGLRVPAHPLVLELIRAAGVPIAAPSANRFTRLSPTTAEHVRRGLGGRVDLILDGGPTTVGIESTVLSLAGPRPVLLRPGMISRQELEASIGPVEIATTTPDRAHPAPGMHWKHYSPSTPLVIVGPGVLPDQGRGAVLWRLRPVEAARSVRMPEDPAAYAAALYQILHEMDEEGWDWIAVEKLPETGEWAGIRDRLARAAAGERVHARIAEEK